MPGFEDKKLWQHTLFVSRTWRWTHVSCPVTNLARKSLPHSKPHWSSSQTPTRFEQLQHPLSHYCLKPEHIMNSVPILPITLQSLSGYPLYCFNSCNGVTTQCAWLGQRASRSCHTNCVSFALLHLLGLWQNMHYHTLLTFIADVALEIGLVGNLIAWKQRTRHSNIHYLSFIDEH